MKLYEPREDSLLLKKHIKKYAKGNVLDVGTGSGIQAVEAKKYADFVLGVDIQKEVINYCKNTHKKENLFFKQSNLLENVKKKFDLITFNPPYLPNDKRVKDITLDGGKHGYELIRDFLNTVNNHLKPDGKILLLFSNLSKKEKVEGFINKNGLKFKKLDEQYMGGFETLYIYLLEKESWNKEVDKNKITDIQYLTSGKRGIVFTGQKGTQKVAMKVINPKSEAINRTETELNFLKRLERYKIAPKVLLAGKNFFVMEFIEGKLILQFIKESKKKAIQATLKKILQMMYLLDTLKINKEEMTRPIKHLIITSDTITLLDWERANMTQNPKNLTQFCQFLTSTRVSCMLNKKNIQLSKGKMVKLTQIYKKDMTSTNSDKIIQQLYK
jgi:release factor glutamine methyltransferase